MIIEFPDNGGNKLLQNVSNQDYQSKLYHSPEDHIQTLLASHHSSQSVIRKFIPVFNDTQNSSSLSKFNVQLVVLHVINKGKEYHKALECSFGKMKKIHA